MEQGTTINQRQENKNHDNQQRAQQTTAYYHNPEIESFIESKWISIKDGETKVLKFIPHLTQIVDKTSFNGTPIKKVRFTVIDINTGNTQEKYFELSRQHVAPIYKELKAGKTILEISRLGTAKETRYFTKSIR